MNLETSVADDDKYDDDDMRSDFDDLDNRIHRKKRQHSAEIRRRIEERLEEKWLRQELGDLDTY